MEGEKEVRFIIQRVRHASVTIDGEVRGKIGKGFMVLIGIGADDTKEIADKLQIPLRTVEDHIYKTLTELRKVLMFVILFRIFP